MIGKVTSIEKDVVEAAPFLNAPNKVAYKIAVVKVETALAGHPAVLEAAVVPAEDEDGLLKPKAFVVLKDGAPRDSLADELKAHVKSSVGPWKYPRWISVVDSLPKTATGKIQRFTLRAAPPSAKQAEGRGEELRDDEADSK